MSVKRNGLGRNLSALLGSSAVILKPESQLKPSTLSLTQLQPGKYQPRQSIDDDSLNELAASIAKQGLLQPLIVRPLKDERYEIIAGERRWRACQLAGLTEAPVVIKEVNDETAMALALIENIQREDLNPVDSARAMLRLSEEFELTHQEIAELLSKSRTTVTNQLRLLNLNKEIIVYLEKGQMDMGHARALLTLPPEQQVFLAQQIVAHNLSVRETEQWVKRLQEEKDASPKSRHFEIPNTVQTKVASLAQYLKSTVQIKPGKKGKGSLVIHYSAFEELDGMIAKIMGIDINP